MTSRDNLKLGTAAAAHQNLATYMKPRSDHMLGARVPIFTPWPSKTRPELATPPRPPSDWTRALAGEDG